MTGELTIRSAHRRDVPEIVAIYNDVLRTSSTIWSEQPATVTERESWLEEKRSAGFPVLVAAGASEVVGFVAAGTFRAWPGYAATNEHSVHVRADARGRGIGTHMMKALESDLRASGVHVMVAGIDAENLGSIRFHARLGFVEVARMPEVGRVHAQWRELVLMQKILE